MQLSEHFSEEEFLRSETAKKYKINNTWELKKYKDNAIYLCKNVLDPLREIFGKIRITSGYRCPALNNKVGGSKDSTHVTGRAADIFPLNVSLEELWQYVKVHHKGGKAIKLNQFVHIDTGSDRTWEY